MNNYQVWPNYCIQDYLVNEKDKISSFYLQNLNILLTFPVTNILSCIENEISCLLSLHGTE